MANRDTSDRADTGEPRVRGAVAGKRPYTAPKLLIHGKITDLTGKPGGTQDNNNHS
jgi:hypothetical protein